MTLDEAYEYVSMAHESEGEQRAEYGMGAVSMGYDPGDWSAAYDGYRCADDPMYREAQRIIDADRASRPVPAPLPVSSDDIPF
jgi:hypothetical protein